jgi:hypothetical protein
VDAARIVVLDRENHDSGAHHAVGLWGALKRWLVPDFDAHHYAEGVTRGHPLLVADIDQAQHDAAVAALDSAHPLNVDEHAAGWRDDGWDGTHAGQAAWIDAAEDEAEAPGNAGVRSGGFITGDYGAVGAHMGDAADTDILRARGSRVRSYRIG